MAQLATPIQVLPALPPSIADLTVGHYLRIDLNGGWAMVKSKKWPVDPLYRYRLELEGTCNSLIQDHAWAEIVFLDASNNVIMRYATPAIDGNKKWHELRSELASVPAGAQSMQVRLLIRPKKLSGEFDITGSAGFDNVMIRRLPQMRVETDQRLAIYGPNDQPTLTARVLGLGHRAADIHFELRDIHKRVIDRRDISFVAEAIDPSAVNRTLITTVPNEFDEPEPADEKLQGIAHWQLPRLAPGYYEVRSILGDPKHPTLSTDTSFAILSDLPTPIRPGNYGWTIPSRVRLTWTTNGCLTGCIVSVLVSSSIPVGSPRKTLLS